jgi:hypothetical protein
MKRIVDVRSDTITQPTEEMREAMRNAVVGDDYYREDPTVVELEELAAAKLGKEAGLFVASGTMGTLVSILTHTQRGMQSYWRPRRTCTDVRPHISPLLPASCPRESRETKASWIQQTWRRRYLPREFFTPGHV